jgi:hypothetical protein
MALGIVPARVIVLSYLHGKIVIFPVIRQGAIDLIHGIFLPAANPASKMALLSSRALESLSRESRAVSSAFTSSSVSMCACSTWAPCEVSGAPELRKRSIGTNRRNADTKLDFIE